MEKSFDSKKAESLLREVFLTPEIQNELNVSEELIERVVTAASIEQIQKERLANLDEAKAVKMMLEQKFPKLRFSARVKSLPSIYGKILKRRMVFKRVKRVVGRAYYLDV